MVLSIYYYQYCSRPMRYGLIIYHLELTKREYLPYVYCLHLTRINNIETYYILRDINILNIGRYSIKNFSFEINWVKNARVQFKHFQKLQ